MRVFITGIAGFLGSHLADAFLARGDHVGGIDSLIGGRGENVPSGATWVHDTCIDLDRMKKSLRGVDVLYHCAATAHEGLSVFSPAENAENGYYASSVVFSAAVAMGVTRIVFTSSMARYGLGEREPPFTEDMHPVPEDPYGIGKFASELLLWKLAHVHKFEAVVAVPHNIYGPRQKYDDPYRNVVSIFANRLLQGKQPIIYGDGSQQRCFSYYTDCIDPLVKMGVQADVVGETINIGPDHEVVSVLDVAKTIADVVGHPLDPVFIDPRPSEVKFAHCSADKARRLLGYEPRMPLRRGIEKTVQWIERNGPKPFDYPIDIEIDNSPLLPKTWSKRLY